MSAITDAALTIIATLFAGAALSTAWCVYVPRPTRAVCLVVGVPAGGYALSRMPWQVGTAVAALLVFCLMVDGVRQRPRWTRRARQVASRSGLNSTAAGRVFLAWLSGRLAYRRALAESLAGVALSAMANACESCERAPATTQVEYPDGQSFRVCGLCGSAAVHHGVARSAS